MSTYQVHTSAGDEKDHQLKLAKIAAAGHVFSAAYDANRDRYTNNQIVIDTAIKATVDFINAIDINVIGKK